MVRFECLRCLQCCFFASDEEAPVILPEERNRLEKLASKANVKLKFTKVDGKELYRWVIKGYCPFYDIGRRKCKIYGERPLACKMFPLLINPENGEVSMSRACDWVTANFNEILKDTPQHVFPSELDAAITVFKALRRQNLLGEWNG